MGMCCTLLVIVPVLNEEKHIQQCLESILANGPDDTRIVVFDNASSDATAELVGELAAHHANVTLIERNGETVPAWKNWVDAYSVSMELVEPEFVCFTSGNDFHDDLSLANAVAALSKSKHDFAVPSFAIDPDPGYSLLSPFPLAHRGLVSSFMLGYKWERAHLLYSVFKSEVLRQLMFDPVSVFRSESTGDWWFTYELLFGLGSSGEFTSGTYVKRSREVANWDAYHSLGKADAPLTAMGKFATIREEFLVPILQTMLRWRFVKRKRHVILALLGTETARLRNLLVRLRRGIFE